MGTVHPATITLDPPSGDQLRAARQAARLTQEACANMMCTNWKRWSEWERGVHRMPATTWSLFLLAVGEHPCFSLRKKGA